MMDKVKQYWTTVIKEREGFWSSLFSKYEEDKQDVDLESYMNNSSSRINTLLQLAVDDQEDEASEHPCTRVTKNSEGQSCESSDATIPFHGDITQGTKEKELKDVNHPIASVKKAEPTFVVEILPEEEDEKWNSILHSTKKLKLFESSMMAENGLDGSVASNHSGNSSESPVSDDEALNDSSVPNISMQNESVRYVCRRVKSGSTHAPSSKRFKLV